MKEWPEFCVELPLGILTDSLEEFQRVYVEDFLQNFFEGFHEDLVEEKCCPALKDFLGGSFLITENFLA